jgi:hypothetical protein
MIEIRAGGNYDQDDVVEADLVDFDLDTLREIVSIEEKEVISLVAEISHKDYTFLLDVE